MLSFLDSLTTFCTHIGPVIAGVVMTAFMCGLLTGAPHSVELWLLYMGTVGSFSVLLKYFQGKGL